jgi:hypothetical protein
MNTTPSYANDPIIQSSARWFWWIAGLSLVNAVMFYSGSDTNFVIGLAMTTLESVYFTDQPVIAYLLIALTIGLYLYVGLEAKKANLWAFYLGLAVYIIDAMLYINYEAWMSVA